MTDELQLVEDNLIRAIRSREQTLTDIAAHLICGGGKRVRPMVTLLAFNAFGGKRTQDIVDIATAIELIHTATLLHDDIIDRAETGAARSLLIGNSGPRTRWLGFSFIKAFEFAGSSMRQLSSGRRMPAPFSLKGKRFKVINRNRAVTLDDYIEIVKRKTASYFKPARERILPGQIPRCEVEETHRYGLNMGIALQMVDDILDVIGHVDLLGKPTGMDLRDGNPSLPIILALKAEQTAVCEAFQSAQPTEALVGAALNAIKSGPSSNRPSPYPGIMLKRHSNQLGSFLLRSIAMGSRRLFN